MEKSPEVRVTNILKMVHGWQNDGQQKDSFYEGNEDKVCPAGCGEREEQLHYIVRKSSSMTRAHIQRRDEFRAVHKKLKTETVIQHACMDTG